MLDSGRAGRRRGTVPDNHLSGDPRCPARNLRLTAPAPGSPPTRSPTSRGWWRCCAAPAQRLGLRRCRPPSLGEHERGRPARRMPGRPATSTRPCARCCPQRCSSALRSDPDPLLRLDLLAEGLIPSLPAADAAARSVATAPATGASARAAAVAAAKTAVELDQALFTTTTCEETPFPWQRSASASNEALRSEIGAARRAGRRVLTRSTRRPRSTRTCCRSALLARRGAGAAGGGAAAGRAHAAALGGAGLRTPTANARAVAAQIPDAQARRWSRSRGTRCSAATSAGCAATAVSSTFFGGGLVQPCRTSTERVRADAAHAHAPALRPHRRASSGAGRGKRWWSVLDTLVDLNRQVISATIEANEALPVGCELRRPARRLRPARTPPLGRSSAASRSSRASILSGTTPCAKG